MTTAALLDRYDRMWQLTQHMLDSARQDDWDRLVLLEQSRSAVVDELRQEDTVVWQAAPGGKKEKLIRAILEADAEIKLLTETRMTELRKNFESVATEKKLNKAYESL